MIRNEPKRGRLMPSIKSPSERVSPKKTMCRMKAYSTKRPPAWFNFQHKDCFVGTTTTKSKVLRNEGLAREKAVAVLDILCSRSMARTRAQWLKEALERSMAISTSSKSGTQAGDAGADAAASSPKVWRAS